MDERDRSQQYYTDIVASMAERTIKRLWIVIILLIVLLVGTNAGWLYYESLWEEVTTTTYEQQADGDSSNYIVGGDLNVSPTEGNDH